MSQQVEMASIAAGFVLCGDTMAPLCSLEDILEYFPEACPLDQSKMVCLEEAVGVISCMRGVRRDMGMTS
jgi:hypothetical protein